MAIELSNTVLEAQNAKIETIDMRTGLADPMLKPPVDNEEVKARIKRFNILHKSILKTGVVVPKVFSRGNRVPSICGQMVKDNFRLEMAPSFCLVLAYSTIGPITWSKHYAKAYNATEPPEEFKVVYLVWVPPYFSQDVYGAEYIPRLMSINAFDDTTPLKTNYTDLDQSLGTRGIVPPVKLRYTSTVPSLPYIIQTGRYVGIPDLGKLPGKLGDTYRDAINRINRIPGWLVGAGNQPAAPDIVPVRIPEYDQNPNLNDEVRNIDVDVRRPQRLRWANPNR